MPQIGLGGLYALSGSECRKMGLVLSCIVPLFLNFFKFEYSSGPSLPNVYEMQPFAMQHGKSVHD